MEGGLQGKVAVVTGASRGIGRAIALELAATGASVVINYVSNEAAADETLTEVTAAGALAIKVQGDVSKLDDAKRIIETAIAELGQVDILVNNAGINRDRTLRRMSQVEWQQVLDTNLGSMYNTVTAVQNHMIERQYGRIINISSIIGQIGNIGQANYAATKAGIIGFTKAASLEYARFNILVNAVCPGFITTDMVNAVPENVKAQMLTRIPQGRFGDPAEVAALVRFLAAEGSYITGQTFNVNGGMYLG
ncbi:MAG: beta-ketoacyl-ACP reductase [Chloroflexi bacterium]|nr:beta-ketoacyl-ACP reductase [Chloroflexota bacterium]